MVRISLKRASKHSGVLKWIDKNIHRIEPGLKIEDHKEIQIENSYYPDLNHKLDRVGIDASGQRVVIDAKTDKITSNDIGQIAGYIILGNYARAIIIGFEVPEWIIRILDRLDLPIEIFSLLPTNDGFIDDETPFKRYSRTSTSGQNYFNCLSCKTAFIQKEPNQHYCSNECAEHLFQYIMQDESFFMFLKREMPHYNFERPFDEDYTDWITRLMNIIYENEQEFINLVQYALKPKFDELMDNQDQLRESVHNLINRTHKLLDQPKQLKLTDFEEDES